MNELSLRDRELVALGAAIASNCVPCVEHHLPKARAAGLTDAELAEVLALADTVRQVPARKVLDAARSVLSVEGACGTGVAQMGCSDALDQVRDDGPCC